MSEKGKSVEQQLAELKAANAALAAKYEGVTKGMSPRAVHAIETRERFELPGNTEMTLHVGQSGIVVVSMKRGSTPIGRWNISAEAYPAFASDTAKEAFKTFTARHEAELSTAVERKERRA